VSAAIGIARDRVSGHAADHGARDNAAKAAVTDCTADETAADRANRSARAVAMTAARIGLRRRDSAPKYDRCNAKYACDPVQHENLRANCSAGRAAA
jgi:hypothetical protein